MAYKMSYGTSRYLIYSCWETRSLEGGSTIGGSLLLDYAMTKEEAETKRQMYQERGDDFEKVMPRPQTSRRYVSIDNRPEWWTGSSR